MKKNCPILKNFRIIFIPVLIIALSSCVDSNYDLNKISDEIEITPGFSGPVATGSLSLDDILNEVSSNYIGRSPSDGLIYVAYSDSLFSNKVADVVKIPNQSFPQIYIASDITIPEWLLASIGQTIKFSKTLNGSFSVSHNERIDSIKIKTTTIKIQISSTFRILGTLRIQTNNVITNGQPFVRDIPVGNTSGTFSTTINISLDNTSVYLKNTNVLPITFELNLIKSGVGITAGQKCDISMAFENIQFSSVFGYLGDYDVLVNSGQFDLGIYDNYLGNGELSFADPSFALFINNSYGIPVQISLSNISAFSQKTNTTIPITFTGVNPFNIKAPDKNQIGKFVQDTITINKNNCNIFQVMESSPKSFSYNVNAKTNPAGPGASYNFVTDSSAIDVNFEIVLPIWIRAKGFSLRDTIDLDINKEFGDVFDFIEYFRFTVEGENEFPMELGMQVYFTDANYITLDSLFVGNSVLLKPPAVAADGKVTQSADFIQSVELTKNRLTGIQNTKYAIFKVNFSTSNSAIGQYVKFYSYYKLDFKLIVKTNLKINSKNL